MRRKRKPIAEPANTADGIGDISKMRGKRVSPYEVRAQRQDGAFCSPPTEIHREGKDGLEFGIRLEAPSEDGDCQGGFVKFATLSAGRASQKDLRTSTRGADEIGVETESYWVGDTMCVTGMFDPMLYRVGFYDAVKGRPVRRYWKTLDYYSRSRKE